MNEKENTLELEFGCQLGNKTSSDPSLSELCVAME